MPLIRVETSGAAVVPDTFVTIADDAALPESGGAIVSLTRFAKERESLLARNAPIGVRLKSDESPEALGDDVQRLSVVAIEFPAFGDGRGFSWARMLRTRLSYTGEIRATGKFIYDQIAHQARTGFNAWELPDGFTLEQFNRALREITHPYQPSADGKKTIRELRAAK